LISDFQVFRYFCTCKWRGSLWPSHTVGIKTYTIVMNTKYAILNIDNYTLEWFNVTQMNSSLSVSLSANQAYYFYLENFWWLNSGWNPILTWSYDNLTAIEIPPEAYNHSLSWEYQTKTYPFPMIIANSTLINSTINIQGSLTVTNLTIEYSTLTVTGSLIITDKLTINVSKPSIIDVECVSGTGYIELEGWELDGTYPILRSTCSEINIPILLKGNNDTCVEPSRDYPQNILTVTITNVCNTKGGLSLNAIIAISASIGGVSLICLVIMGIIRRRKIKKQYKAMRGIFKEHL